MCTCKTCVRNKRLHRFIESLDGSDKKFIREIFDELMDVEMDMEYYHAIVDGSWPSADEIIAEKRHMLNLNRLQKDGDA